MDSLQLGGQLHRLLHRSCHPMTAFVEMQPFLQRRVWKKPQKILVYCEEALLE